LLIRERGVDLQPQKRIEFIERDVRVHRYERMKRRGCYEPGMA
jgi:hypothetical protein